MTWGVAGKKGWARTKILTEEMSIKEALRDDNLGNLKDHKKEICKEANLQIAGEEALGEGKRGLQ